jgi:hypothetical protein
MSLLGRVLAALCMSLALLSTEGVALAQQEKPETEALLRKGIQLRRDGSDEAALAVFLEAEAESPDSVRVLLHVATAAQAASKWLMADEYLRKAAAHDDDPYYQRYRAEIEEVRAATAQRVGQFRAVGEPQGAQVSLNGQVVGTLPMESPKTLEAGTYVLEVTKDGYYRLRRPISVPGAVLTRETVALNVRPPGGPETEEAGGGGGASGPQEEWYESSVVTWSLLGLGIAGGATSGTALFLRNRAADHWNDDTRCLDDQQRDVSRQELCAGVRNDIDIYEQVAIVSGVAGGVFLTMGLVHWLATGDSTEAGVTVKTDANKASRIDCAPGLLSVMCAGTF